MDAFAVVYRDQAVKNVMLSFGGAREEGLRSQLQIVSPK